MKLFYSQQFLMFLCTGGIAAAVNFGSRILYSQWWDFSIAVILAYITGMVTAFVLAKFLVFKESKQGIYRSSLFFLIVNLVAVAQTWLISMLLAYYALPWLGVTEHVKEIAHMTGIIVPAFSSYLGHKYWSFR